MPTLEWTLETPPFHRIRLEHKVMSREARLNVDGETVLFQRPFGASLDFDYTYEFEVEDVPYSLRVQARWIGFSYEVRCAGKRLQATHDPILKAFCVSAGRKIRSSFSRPPLIVMLATLAISFACLFIGGSALHRIGSVLCGFPSTFFQTLPLSSTLIVLLVCICVETVQLLAAFFRSAVCSALLGTASLACGGCGTAVLCMPFKLEEQRDFWLDDVLPFTVYISLAIIGVVMVGWSIQCTQETVGPIQQTEDAA
jgi:hypothetical protein